MSALFLGALARLFLPNQQSFDTLTHPVQAVNAAQLKLVILVAVTSVTVKVQYVFQNIANSKS
ncbi:MAG: hypothetical protein EBR30_15695 [Cytophagia bacterium]|nr:hypothetical protein [Cytophagia bacterium]